MAFFYWFCQRRAPLVVAGRGIDCFGRLAAQQYLVATGSESGLAICNDLAVRNILVALHLHAHLWGIERVFDGVGHRGPGPGAGWLLCAGLRNFLALAGTNPRFGQPAFCSTLDHG